MLKMVFVAVGLGMVAVVTRSFIRPLWRDGFRGLAVVVGLMSVGLLGGLAAMIWSLAP